MLTMDRVFTLSEVARRTLTHPAVLRPSRSKRLSIAKPKWASAILDDLSATRELLDRLENAGRTDRELRILDDSRFEVRWREPVEGPPRRA